MALAPYLEVAVAVAVAVAMAAWLWLHGCGCMAVAAAAEASPAPGTDTPLLAVKHIHLKEPIQGLPLHRDKKEEKNVRGFIKVAHNNKLEFPYE